jgi:hypothetical protein
MSSIQDLTNQAGFVFEGQVEQLGASTSSGFPPSPETAVVSVTRIVKGPPSLDGYGGQRITVQLQPPVTLTAGQQAVFFTNGVHYGDGLVVSELGHAPAGEPAMEAQMNSTIQGGNDSEMMQRLAQAELVVSGTASEPVRHVSAPAGAGRVSEHDPDWASSTITIDTVEKGSALGKTVEVLFPQSRDIAWYQSPKVKAGDHGVWLLHNRDLSGKAVPGLAVVHPLDFRPTTELERVRTLLKGPQ